MRMSQKEKELIRKQGWSGVSAVFRAERSSEPADITAGLEEGDGGTGRGAVSFPHFRSGLLRPSPPCCGLCDSAKTSKFVHKDYKHSSVAERKHHNEGTYLTQLLTATGMDTEELSLKTALWPSWLK